MMFNNKDYFAVILELYYESMKIDENIGQFLYGSSTVVRYDDGLFGKITKLFNIIKVNIHDSWKSDLLCEEDDYVNNDYYRLINADIISWKHKARILNNDKQKYLDMLTENGLIKLNCIYLLDSQVYQFNNEKLTNMSVEDFATIIEVYYESIKIEESVGISLYGESIMASFDKGLFGKINQLYIIIRNNIDPSWREDDYENSLYYNIIHTDELSWLQKATIIKDTKQKWLITLENIDRQNFINEGKTNYPNCGSTFNYNLHDLIETEKFINMITKENPIEEDGIDCDNDKSLNRIQINYINYLSNRNIYVKGYEGKV